MEDMIITLGLSDMLPTRTRNSPANMSDYVSYHSKYRKPVKFAVRVPSLYPAVLFLSYPTIYYFCSLSYLVFDLHGRTPGWSGNSELLLLPAAVGVILIRGYLALTSTKQLNNCPPTHTVAEIGNPILLELYWDMELESRIIRHSWHSPAPHQSTYHLDI